jgi:hypothetical protein
VLYFITSEDACERNKKRRITTTEKRAGRLSEQEKINKKDEKKEKVRHDEQRKV